MEEDNDGVVEKEVVTEGTADVLCPRRFFVVRRGVEEVLNDYWNKFYSHRMDFKLGTQFRVIGFVDVTEYSFF